MINEANAASPRSDTREPALIARAQQGDTDAFAELYKEHRPLVFLYVFSRVGRDRLLAEDLTADVFVRAIAKLRTFTWTGKSIQAWFCTIARNRVADHYRASATQRLTYCAEMLDVCGSWADPADTAEELALAKLEDEQLHQALQKLPLRYRNVLVLRFLRECPVDKAAAVMQISPGALKALQYRATREIRRSLLGVAA